jgi:hypothetical protein
MVVSEIMTSSKSCQRVDRKKRQDEHWITVLIARGGEQRASGGGWAAASGRQARPGRAVSGVACGRAGDMQRVASTWLHVCGRAGPRASEWAEDGGEGKALGAGGRGRLAGGEQRATGRRRA